MHTENSFGKVFMIASSWSQWKKKKAQEDSLHKNMFSETTGCLRDRALTRPAG